MKMKMVKSFVALLWMCGSFFPLSLSLSRDIMIFVLGVNLYLCSLFFRSITVTFSFLPGNARGVKSESVVQM